jgi:hypothetical protein
MPLQTWMRVALYATAVMNLLGAFAFIPLLPAGRDLLNLPGPVHPIYLWIVGEFILVFGVAYAWCALKGRAPRVFIALGAAGKLLFFATLVGFWLAGELTASAAMGGLGDLLFGCLFLVWLYQVRGAGGEVQ